MNILSHPEAWVHFWIKDKLIWTKNQMGRDVVCIPQKAFVWGRRLIKIILNQAHTTKMLQLSTSHNRLIYIRGTSDTYDNMCDFERNHVAILHGDCKTPRDARVHCDQLGSKIHFQILEGITQTHGDEAPHVYLVPSTDGWSNRADKLLHKPSVVGTSLQQPKRLGRTLPNG